MNQIKICLTESNVLRFYLIILLASCSGKFPDQSSKKINGKGIIEVKGELRQWHKITLDLSGPFSEETDTIVNPFTDYRFQVSFTHKSGNPSYEVPGYYAADGNSAITGASSGNIWRAHLCPDKTGTWSYKLSFSKGKNISISREEGESVAPYDAITGSFEILPTDKTGPDLRGKGRLMVVGEHYQQFAGNGEYFLKSGADAPENLLAFDDFDATPDVNDLRKSWSPHLKDYASDADDLLWGPDHDKGKALLGAINYLHNKGMNAFSFLTYNVDGDDHNVFPYILKTEMDSYVSYAADNKGHEATGWEDYFYHDRFDCSKMDQWERIFEYGDRKGMYLHFKTTEAENCFNMDSGYLGNERKLYYRELIARYGHHLALNWNIGEETEQTIEQLNPIIEYIADLDPYRHQVVLHTHSSSEDHEKYYRPMLGNNSALTGISVQTRYPDFRRVHGDILKWVNASAAAGRKWIVACDEPGDASHGLVPDADDPEHDLARKNALWGTFMAGGAGIEWYFGYQHENSDLTCQDWRSRENMWEQSKIALDFFKKNNIPFWEMKNENELTADTTDYIFAKQSDIYIIYLPNGGYANINLNQYGDYSVEWFNPSKGGALFQGEITQINGLQSTSLGPPPQNSEVSEDWAIVLKKQ